MRRPSALHRCHGLAAILALAAPAVSGAEDRARADAPEPPPSAPVILEDDPSGLLGLGLVDFWSRFGPPSSVNVVRGDAAWQDDVAFLYEAGYTLFIYGDRVWQFRFTKPYAGSIYGLFLGDSSDKALSALGQPYESGPSFLLYRMPYKSYPVRLRLSLQEDRIAEVYLYRADF